MRISYETMQGTGKLYNIHDILSLFCDFDFDCYSKRTFYSLVQSLGRVVWDEKKEKTVGCMGLGAWFGRCGCCGMMLNNKRLMGKHYLIWSQ